MVNISPVEPPSWIRFLYFSDQKGKSYNQIYTARSALASIIIPQNIISFGNLPIVKRYINDVFEKNPTLPKHHYIWNASPFFNTFPKYASD